MKVAGTINEPARNARNRNLVCINFNNICIDFKLKKDIKKINYDLKSLFIN